MIAVTVSDGKGMMGELLLRDEFEQFLIVEGSITTFLTYSIDGQLQRDFFDGEKEEEIREERRTFARWGEVRNLCYQMIKGKRTPLGFRFVFQLPRPETEKLLKESSLSCQEEDVFGLYLNCQYDGGNLVLTTGTSLRFFTLDKSLDHLWDEFVAAFLKEKKIC